MPRFQDEVARVDRRSAVATRSTFRQRLRPNVPGTRGLGRASGGQTPHAEYERMKQAWLAAHPDATPDNLEAACRRIADRLCL